MKILLTTFTYPPNADGVAEASAVKAEGFVRLGHEVTVATAFHPDRKQDDAAANPRVVQFHVSGNGNWRMGVHGEIKKYQDFLQNFDCDLIIFEGWHMWSTSLARPLLSRINAKKILPSQGYYLQVWNFYPKFAWGLIQWMGWWPFVLRTPFLMRKFDQLVFLSHRRDFRSYFDHWLARATGFKKISIIPNGAFANEFDDEALPDFREEHDLGSGLLVICVANYSERKNQCLAIRAFRKARIKGATLVLIGSEFNDYSEKVRQLNKEMQKALPDGKVLMLEKQSRRQTCTAYCAADLFLLTAKSETQPIVLLEAMASHTPWLSTDTGCVSELPGGLVGYSEKDLVKKLQTLAESPSQREKLQTEGWNAHQKTYDWKQVVTAYENLIQKICQ